MLPTDHLTTDLPYNYAICLFTIIIAQNTLSILAVALDKNANFIRLYTSGYVTSFHLHVRLF